MPIRTIPVRRLGTVMSSIVWQRCRAARLRCFRYLRLFRHRRGSVYISYVASNGNDADPCTVVTAPCKTLARALSVTPTSGTVKVLTALQSNVVINKSITISGDGAPIVGTIVISGASTKVALRGLQLNGVDVIANGIRIDSAAAVHIEDCTVERYTGDGILLLRGQCYRALHFRHGLAE